MLTATTILSGVMEGNPRGSTLPERLASKCALALPVTGVGLALMTDAGHEGMVAATDDVASTMEELQFTLGEGPCRDASTNGRPALHPELARDAALWPGFGPAALETGIASIFAFPLQVGGLQLGVLDLYRDTVGGLTLDQIADALAFAEAATVILVHLQSQMAPGKGLHPQLADAVGSRPEIHQATGMITMQASVGALEALLLLRARAFSTSRPVLDVARDVVSRRLRFDMPPDER